MFYDTRNSYVIIHQGKEVIQYYIDELISEGVTYLAPFESSAIEASDVVPLASRPGECKIY